jgi:membrane-associated phospholipid phosphatase
LYSQYLFLIAVLVISIYMPFKNASIPLVFFLAFAFLSQNSFAQQGADRFMHWLIDDPAYMVSDFGSKQLYTVASVGVSLSIIAMGDDLSSRHFQQQYGQSKLLHFTNLWGEWKIAGAASAGIFTSSMITRNKKFQDAAFTSMQSLIMTNLTVNTAKFVFGRERPYQEDGPYDFDFVQPGGTSFPSGHTATAFALVTPWVVYYPGPVTYALMAIPAGTAIARVAKGRHWFSDVTAGAAIGFSMGHYLAKKHLNLQSDRVQVIPTAGYDHFSLALNFSF